MAKELSEVRMEIQYHRAAQEYLRRLPPEHFMEATAQATQRKITLESFDLITGQRPDVHLFNELLVQYPLPRHKPPGQVVPDNMVVVHAGPIKAEASYDVPLQPARPFMMLEYVSKNSERKDYDDNMVKYEKELEVPYYLLFHPDAQELTLYHYHAGRYASVKPNEEGRYAIPELELAVALIDGWARFWFRSHLLPLPADMLRELQKARQELQAAQETVKNERQARQAAEQEIAKLRAELEHLRKP
jgi:Uma2 family endonuclease